MPSRIGLKLGIGYAVLITFVMTCVGYYLVSVTRDFVIAELRERLVAECNLVHEAFKATSEDEFAKLAPAIEQSIGARITIITQAGQVVVETDAPAIEMDLHNTRPEVVDALEKGTGWALRKSLTLNTNLLYVARHYGPQEPVVRLAMPLTSVDQTASGVQRAIVMATLAAALLCVIGGFLFTHNVTQSLAHLTSVARKLGSGELDTRVSLHSNDETSELANALNGMATRLASAQKSLEEQAAHLQAMLSQMADGIVAVGPDEKVQIFNKSAGELLQTNPQDALGRRLSEVALNYELVEVVRRALRLRTMGRAEVDTSHEGSRILAAAVSPVEGEDGVLIGAVMALRDMTEIRRLENVRQDFVANASHELRTPVAAIRSLAETLSGGAMNDVEIGPRFLEQIVHNTENLARLLDDMMTLARLEATQNKPEPITVNVSKIITGAVSRLEPQAREKRIKVNTGAPEDLFAWCAEDDLTAALVNLVDNAIKYTPEDGRVEIEAVTLDDQVKISVTDTGPGIPENLRTRIFERFYRVDKGRSRALGGTGLGLSIVKHAIEASGGRVWVEDGPDGGACFVIILSAGPCQVDFL